MSDALENLRDVGDRFIDRSLFALSLSSKSMASYSPPIQAKKVVRTKMKMKKGRRNDGKDDGDGDG